MISTAVGIVPEIKIHQRLVIARQHVDMNQQEFARLLGVTTSTVQRAESGATQPRRTTLMAWSMATGVNLHWLETGHAPRPSDEGPDLSCELPHLDSNQKPADYQSYAHASRDFRRPRDNRPGGLPGGRRLRLVRDAS